MQCNIIDIIDDKFLFSNNSSVVSVQGIGSCCLLSRRAPPLLYCSAQSVLEECAALLVDDDLKDPPRLQTPPTSSFL